MFYKTAEFYDAVYSWKDYESEAEQVRAIVAARKSCAARTLLDIACGTGAHIEHLKRDFDVVGVDLDPQMIAIARERHPEVTIHQGDMIDFDLGRSFDVVTCLFSSIGYVKDVDRLDRAVANFARHLATGGILVVDPWFLPDKYTPGTLHANFVDLPDLKIARINNSEIEGTLSIIDFHYLIGTPQGVEHRKECHELRLFTHEQYLEAFAHAGLEVEHDERGLSGHGLYIGTRPA